MRTAKVQCSCYFNPRSREGSDGDFGFDLILYLISIHAPARGATCCWIRKCPSHTISIHAPARGATHVHLLFIPDQPYFNPRSREGSDFFFCLKRYILFNFNPRSREGSDFCIQCSFILLLISIHAPARGATSVRCFETFCKFYFNPRSREGSDQHENLAMQSYQKFQSTLPRGERQKILPFLRAEVHFNPRSREGSDRNLRRIIATLRRFQSTLPRGERREAAW